ncbi:MAG: 5-(carboxyamino)imidazole ribonucleotide mutase [Elusimicrobia bacterium CG1_02_37_114]|nr:MAG: 5-(carboxyamino)imidazole ribonucleotide mutase [Elusimicrobia bacterium CG1_02_37_114]PIV53076.1 MAG: 5-(carboxyamino)imidazole ribonucleotide mutase [Elusimicrobia bacterium CG02_land_8_20_14_3_00_37_13]PIZ13549.1 MAG: 5-(carboxyamino)imidazole ribonucleotide mutase [Elusimicrobia bacterium CG_4_10_14_0_8_um_filter_37_32]
MEVFVIAGSKSDEELIERVKKVLDDFGIDCETMIISAHRQPEKLSEVIKKSNTKVYIAIAGMAAHLPGVIASYTTRPVIGVAKNASFSGLDSLLSIVQMPRGVPVACVGIDMAENAAILACQILALNDKKLEKKLMDYKLELGKK